MIYMIPYLGGHSGIVWRFEAGFFVCIACGHKEGTLSIRRQIPVRLS